MTLSPELNGVTTFFRTRLFPLAVLLIAISLPYQAVSLQNNLTDDQREQRILQFYELGLLGAFTTNTSESIQEIISDLTEEQDDAIFETIILEAFRETRMEVVILSSIRRSFRNNDLNALNAMTHLMDEGIQQLMGKLYNNQTDFDDPEIVDQFEDYISRIEVNPAPYQQRIDLVSSILKRSQTTRLTVQTLEDFLTIIVFTLNQTNPEDERLTDRQVNDLIISLRSNFRQLFDNIMLYVSLYSTRDFGLELLQQHADFLATDAGRWFIRTYNNAVLNSFGEVSENVATNLAEWVLAQSVAEEVDESGSDSPLPSVPEQ